MKKISVIVPVYNQESIIASNVPKIISIMDTCGFSYEILLINDGSTDNSNNVLKHLIHPEIRIIEKKNQGLGSVLKIGFAKAVGEIFIIIDLDLSYDVQNILRVIELSKNWDCVVCSKYAQSNTYPLFRKILSFLHYQFCDLFFDINVRDMGSGIVMVHSSFVRDQSLISNGFGIHCEFFLSLHKKKARILEIPVKYTHYPGSYRFIFHSIQTVKELFAIVRKQFISD